MLGVGRRNFSFVAIKLYNIIPNKLRLLQCKYKTIKYHIKLWIKNYFNTETKIDNFLIN